MNAVPDTSTPCAPAGAPAADRCPRCGGAFRCGALDAAPCACTQFTLAPAQLATLRERYVGCLCGACLRELATTGAAP